MSERFISVATNAQHARTVAEDLWKWLKAMTVAGHRVHIEAKPETRSTAQNRLLHSRISDVSKQVQWAGKLRDIDTWKRLLTAAWLRTRGEAIELLPAIDGHGVDIVFRRTSSLVSAECAELADYILAWGDGEGVKWSKTSLGRDWPEEICA